MNIRTQCPQCKKVTHIEVIKEDYEAWQSGAFVQDAFPNMSADVREMLVSGIDGECWDKLFDFDEGED